MLKYDVIRFVKDFHKNFVLVKSVNSSVLTIVHKVEIPLKLDDYRPIFLVGYLLKSISKILPTRLKKVLHILVSDNQTTFVLGRQLLDGVLVANEVVDYVIKKKKSCFLFKVDFEKSI